MGNKFSLEQRTLAEELLETRKVGEKRTCKECGKEDFLGEFSGRVIKHLTFLQVSFSTLCKTCSNKENVIRVKKARKENPDYVRTCMYWKRSKRMGVKSDLKLRDVRMMLRCPCYYCGTSDSIITLDRKDSMDGYTRKNTVPCCLRCNMIKSDMPWEAWQKLIPAVKNVAKLGLFGRWKEKMGSRPPERVR